MQLVCVERTTAPTSFCSAKCTNLYKLLYYHLKIATNENMDFLTVLTEAKLCAFLFTVEIRASGFYTQFLPDFLPRERERERERENHKTTETSQMGSLVPVKQLE